jgi:hypothetical protein
MAGLASDFERRDADLHRTGGESGSQAVAGIAGRIAPGTGDTFADDEADGLPPGSATATFRWAEAADPFGKPHRRSAPRRIAPFPGIAIPRQSVGPLAACSRQMGTVTVTLALGRSSRNLRLSLSDKHNSCYGISGPPAILEHGAPERCGQLGTTS